MMKNINIFFEELYRNFNDRKIELVIANLTPDVKWANGMEGGYVNGHDGVREYWTRQFTMVSSQVTPLQIDAENGVAKIKVRQIVHDMKGNLLADDVVHHYFHWVDDCISRFDIGS